MGLRHLRALLVVLVIASALGGVYLVFGDVRAPTVEPDRSNCGSALSVVHRGSGYQGGELRVDEPSFDAACVDRARNRLYLAIAPGAVLAVSALGLLVFRPPRRTRSPSNPPTYIFRG